MSLSLVTAPTAEPLTLAEARSHLRVDHVNDDALIAGYILAAREHAETDTRRALVTQTWDLKISGGWPKVWDADRKEWRTGIALPRPPFVSVTSVAYVDTAGATQTLAADQYQAVATNGRSREGVIYPAYGVTWPEVRDQPGAITVRFVAGYGDPSAVPRAIKQAMLLLIGHFNENREAVNVGNIVNEMPFAVDSLLFPFRAF